MRRWFLLLLLLPGCSLEPLSPDEIEWRHQMDRENWALCELAHKQSGSATFHRGHTHADDRVTRISHVRQDLADNHCRMILGPYWAS